MKRNPYFAPADWLALDLGQMLPQGQPQKRGAGSDAFYLMQSATIFGKSVENCSLLPTGNKPQNTNKWRWKRKNHLAVSLGLKFESNQQRNIICKLKAEPGMPFRKGRAKVRIGILWIDLDIDVCRRNHKQILNKICNIFQFIFAFDNLLVSMQAKVRINKL